RAELRRVDVRLDPPRDRLAAGEPAEPLQAIRRPSGAFARQRLGQDAVLREQVVVDERRRLVQYLVRLHALPLPGGRGASGRSCDTKRWSPAAISGSAPVGRQVSASKRSPSRSDRPQVASVAARSATMLAWGYPAIRSASSSARASAFPAGTISCTNPMASARSASTRMPFSIM